MWMRKINVKLAGGKERTIQHMMSTSFWSPDGKDTVVYTKAVKETNGLMIDARWNSERLTSGGVNR